MAFNLVSAEQIKAVNLDNSDLPEDSGSGMTIKVDTAANLKKENPVLLKGQLGAESDTTYMKLGNGTTTWNDLEYTKTKEIIDSSVTANSTNLITSGAVKAYVDNALASIVDSETKTY